MQGDWPVFRKPEKLALGKTEDWKTLKLRHLMLEDRGTAEALQRTEITIPHRELMDYWLQNIRCAPNVIIVCSVQIKYCMDTFH